MGKKNFLKKTGEHKIDPFNVKVMDFQRPIYESTGEPDKVLEDIKNFFKVKYG